MRDMWGFRFRGSYLHWILEPETSHMEYLEPPGEGLRPCSFDMGHSLRIFEGVAGSRCGPHTFEGPSCGTCDFQNPSDGEARGRLDFEGDGCRV